MATLSTLAQQSTKPHNETHTSSSTQSSHSTATHSMPPSSLSSTPAVSLTSPCLSVDRVRELFPRLEFFSPEIGAAAQEWRGDDVDDDDDDDTCEDVDRLFHIEKDVCVGGEEKQEQNQEFRASNLTASCLIESLSVEERRAQSLHILMTLPGDITLFLMHAPFKCPHGHSMRKHMLRQIDDLFRSELDEKSSYDEDGASMTASCTSVDKSYGSTAPPGFCLRSLQMSSTVTQSKVSSSSSLSSHISIKKQRECTEKLRFFVELLWPRRRIKDKKVSISQTTNASPVDAAIDNVSGEEKSSHGVESDSPLEKEDGSDSPVSTADGGSTHTSFWSSQRNSGRASTFTSVLLEESIVENGGSFSSSVDKEKKEVDNVSASLTASSSFPSFLPLKSRDAIRSDHGLGVTTAAAPDGSSTSDSMGKKLMCQPCPSSSTLLQSQMNNSMTMINGQQADVDVNIGVQLSSSASRPSLRTDTLIKFLSLQQQQQPQKEGVKNSTSDKMCTENGKGQKKKENCQLSPHESRSLNGVGIGDSESVVHQLSQFLRINGLKSGERVGAVEGHPRLYNDNSMGPCTASSSSASFGSGTPPTSSMSATPLSFSDLSVSKDVQKAIVAASNATYSISPSVSESSGGGVGICNGVRTHGSLMSGGDSGNGVRSSTIRRELTGGINNNGGTLCNGEEASFSGLLNSCSDFETEDGLSSSLLHLFNAALKNGGASIGGVRSDCEDIEKSIGRKGSGVSTFGAGVKPSVLSPSSLATLRSLSPTSPSMASLSTTPFGASTNGNAAKVDVKNTSKTSTNVPYPKSSNPSTSFNGGTINMTDCHKFPTGEMKDGVFDYQRASLEDPQYRTLLMTAFSPSPSSVLSPDGVMTTKPGKHFSEAQTFAMIQLLFRKRKVLLQSLQQTESLMSRIIGRSEGTVTISDFLSLLPTNTAAPTAVPSLCPAASQDPTDEGGANNTYYLSDNSSAIFTSNAVSRMNSAPNTVSFSSTSSSALVNRHRKASLGCPAAAPPGFENGACRQYQKMSRRAATTASSAAAAEVAAAAAALSLSLSPHTSYISLPNHTQAALSPPSSSSCQSVVGKPVCSSQINQPSSGSSCGTENRATSLVNPSTLVGLSSSSSALSPSEIAGLSVTGVSASFDSEASIMKINDSNSTNNSNNTNKATTLNNITNYPQNMNCSNGHLNQSNSNVFKNSTQTFAANSAAAAPPPPPPPSSLPSMHHNHHSNNINHSHHNPNARSISSISCPTPPPPLPPPPSSSSIRTAPPTGPVASSLSGPSLSPQSPISLSPCPSQTIKQQQHGRQSHPSHVLSVSQRSDDVQQTQSSTPSGAAPLSIPNPPLPLPSSRSRNTSISSQTHLSPRSSLPIPPPSIHLCNSPTTSNEQSPSSGSGVGCVANNGSNPNVNGGFPIRLLPSSMLVSSSASTSQQNHQQRQTHYPQSQQLANQPSVAASSMSTASLPSNHFASSAHQQTQQKHQSQSKSSVTVATAVKTSGAARNQAGNDEDEEDDDIDYADLLDEKRGDCRMPQTFRRDVQRSKTTSALLTHSEILQRLSSLLAPSNLQNEGQNSASSLHPSRNNCRLKNGNGHTSSSPATSSTPVFEDGGGASTGDLLWLVDQTNNLLSSDDEGKMGARKAVRFSADIDPKAVSNLTEASELPVQTSNLIGSRNTIGFSHSSCRINDSSGISGGSVAGKVVSPSSCSGKSSNNRYVAANTATLSQDLQRRDDDETNSASPSASSAASSANEHNLFHSPQLSTASSLISSSVFDPQTSLFFAEAFTAAVQEVELQQQQQSQAFERPTRRIATLPSVPGDIRIQFNDVQHMLHMQGRCKPCAFHYNKKKGCRNGDSCEFCHHEDHSKLTLKQWKKQQQKLLRAVRSLKSDGTPGDDDIVDVDEKSTKQPQTATAPISATDPGACGGSVHADTCISSLDGGNKVTNVSSSTSTPFADSLAIMLTGASSTSIASSSTGGARTGSLGTDAVAFSLISGLSRSTATFHSSPPSLSSLSTASSIGVMAGDSCSTSMKSVSITPNGASKGQNCVSDHSCGVVSVGGGVGD